MVSSAKQIIEWGESWSYSYRADPKRFHMVLARYKFAAQLATKNRFVVELGCGEGIGATILGERAKHYTGVDYDEKALDTARANLSGEHYEFIQADLMGKSIGSFQTVVSLDVIEHVYPEHEQLYLETVWKNLADDGVAIIGTPNATSEEYASPPSKEGHVNLFTQERLKNALLNYFSNVFCFGMNDEIVHTGFAPMSHYIICLACNRRSSCLNS